MCQSVSVLASSLILICKVYSICWLLQGCGQSAIKMAFKSQLKMKPFCGILKVLSINCRGRYFWDIIGVWCRLLWEAAVASVSFLLLEVVTWRLLSSLATPDTCHHWRFCRHCICPFCYIFHFDLQDALSWFDNSSQLLIIIVLLTIFANYL